VSRKGLCAPCGRIRKVFFAEINMVRNIDGHTGLKIDIGEVVFGLRGRVVFENPSGIRAQTENLRSSEAPSSPIQQRCGLWPRQFHDEKRFSDSEHDRRELCETFLK